MSICLYNWIKVIIEKEFKEKPETVFSDLLYKKNEKIVSSNSILLQHSSQVNKLLCEEDLRNLYFGDFMKNKDETGQKSYEEITNLEKLKQVFFFITILFYM